MAATSPLMVFQNTSPVCAWQIFTKGNVCRKKNYGRREVEERMRVGVGMGEG